MQRKHLVILIVFLVGIIFLQHECQRCPECLESTFASDTIYLPGDTIRDTTEIEKLIPHTIFVDTGSTLWKYHNVDTNAILLDYYTKKYFNPVLKDDTSAFIELDFYLFNNDIFDMKLTFQNRRPTVINNSVSYPDKKLKLFIGGGLYGNANFQGATLNLALLTKKDHLYEIGYDPFHKYSQFRMFWKIKLRKGNSTGD